MRDTALLKKYINDPGRSDTYNNFTKLFPIIYKGWNVQTSARNMFDFNHLFRNNGPTSKLNYTEKESSIEDVKNKILDEPITIIKTAVYIGEAPEVKKVLYIGGRFIDENKNVYTLENDKIELNDELTTDLNEYLKSEEDVDLSVKIKAIAQEGKYLSIRSNNENEKGVWLEAPKKSPIVVERIKIADPITNKSKDEYRATLKDNIIYNFFFIFIRLLFQNNDL